jgi:hypothetical protein
VTASDAVSTDTIPHHVRRHDAGVALQVGLSDRAALERPFAVMLDTDQGPHPRHVTSPETSTPPRE